ncbi:MAG: hypothetical protein ABI699_05265 [Caldimonas sp.]
MIDSIPAPVRTVALLTASNLFMTLAGYGHLEPLRHDFLRAGLCPVGATCFAFRAP